MNEELKTLSDKLDRVDQNLNSFILEMRVWRGEQLQICKGHREQTDELEKAIDGNGKPGLKSQIDTLEKQNITLENALAIQKWILGIVTPLFVALMIYGAYYLITHPQEMINKEDTNQVQTVKKP